MSTTLHRALGAAIVICVSLAAAGPARAERGLAESAPLSRHVVEADLLIGFGQHLGRAPTVSPGAGVELRLARFLGVAAGGHATIAVPASMGFLEATATGGGWDAALRLYLRGTWPRGFGVGAAMGLSAVPGVAIATPRVELFYRFVLFDHLAVRINGVVGGVILWDTTPDDQRAGPAPFGPEAVDSSDFDSFSQRGWLLGLGISVGWAGESPARSRFGRRR